MTILRNTGTLMSEARQRRYQAHTCPNRVKPPLNHCQVSTQLPEIGGDACSLKGAPQAQRTRYGSSRMEQPNTGTDNSPSTAARGQRQTTAAAPG